MRASLALAPGLAFFLTVTNLVTQVRADFTSTTLLVEGYWSVELVSSEEFTWCHARTLNPADQEFAITAGTLGVHLRIFDQAWNLRSRPVDLALVIETENWLLTGEANRTEVTVDLGAIQYSEGLLESLSSGNWLEVQDSYFEPITLFSLRGSRAAITALGSCYERYIVGSDPF